ncbi:MAG: hypothetical protein DRJ40_10815 [Thermoprotei archaeon]|nr:MAG: hypothetical protein DRJ40_10815 [Thermoprotei archaeon]
MGKLIRELYSIAYTVFPDRSLSFYVRSVVRCFFVDEISEGHYIVRGLREFGDHYPTYHVFYFPRERRYRCECQLRLYGYVRRICTHIGAVAIYRRVIQDVDIANRFFKWCELVRKSVQLPC